MGLPLCAATRCPSQNDCQGYITTNAGNPELLAHLVACCKVLCSEGDKGILALQCGGASNSGAYFIASYIVVLTIAAFGMLIVGLSVKFKRLSFLISAFGTAIFGTAVTGIYVTYVTSSFTYLQALVPAVGAMIIAVFSYFFAGFEYNVGVTYGSGPLVALLTAVIPIWKAVPENRDSNRVALTMLFFAFLWVLHSVSFRVLGYRVLWRHFEAPKRREAGNPVNVCYLLGAGQSHPTWKTPVGQTTCLLFMAFAWAIARAARHDLKNQQCEADWVLNAMIWIPPSLMTAAFVYILLSALRGRTIKHKIRAILYTEERVGEYPGMQYYREFRKFLRASLSHYKQVVALHRRGRNTYTTEVVPEDMVETLDKVIGTLAWLLALFGLLMGWPVTKAMSCMAHFVTTTVSEEHQEGAKRVLTASYVGPYEQRTSRMAKMRSDLNTADDETGRYINLPYLLDTISHEELHALLNRPNEPRKLEPVKSKPKGLKTAKYSQYKTLPV
ncbi:hypothetical protein KC19_2G276300 [Ceratodon purpureus]|uniref:Uncharacterized protein n=1 Tax=Ceratodon purpureus TaxID=3225 RepID=A0A8T0IYV8_CERPU|nr:hypothetical protein KC19_2G276300 [Ceratodon purpureus]